MIKYKFDEDEVLLSRSKAYVENNQNCLFRVLVTNKYLVFMPYYQETTSDDENVLKVELSQIKIYEGQPQVKKYDHNVEIYLTTDVLTLSFLEKKEEHMFISTITTLLTNKTSLERGIEKLGSTYTRKTQIIDESFGVDSKSIIKNTGIKIKNAFKTGLSTVAGALGATATSSKKNRLGIFTDGIAGGINAALQSMNRNTNYSLEHKEKSFDDMCDNLIKLKELLDSGAITPDEYDAQKAQLMANA